MMDFNSTKKTEDDPINVTTTTTSTTASSSSEDSQPISALDEKERVYRMVTIGIVISGIFLLVSLIAYIYYDNRRNERNRRNRDREVRTELKGDIPPTYSQIVLRKDPPNYDESVMQEVNPEDNPEWGQDLEEGKVSQEVKERIAKKVDSAVHGFLYQEALHADERDLQEIQTAIAEADNREAADNSNDISANSEEGGQEATFEVGPAEN